MNRKCIGLACFVVAMGLSLASVASGQESKAPEGHGVIKTTDLKWAPIMKGCEMAPVSGDPSAEGTPFVIRLKCVAGTKIPAHWHPTDENVTVLQGTFQVGMGDKYDAAKLETAPSGSFTTVPKEARHFALSKTASILQVHGIGPFKVNWVNPEDVIPPDAPKKSK